MVCLTALPGNAWGEQGTFEDRIPRSMLQSEDNSFLTFTVENDMFGGGPDRNYTNGVRVTWADMGAEPPRLARLLDRYVPSFRVNETTSVYYSLGQNLYTPEDILILTPDPLDRPYAAFLYASAGFASVTDNHIDDIEITLGVIGPLALGEQTQKTVHDIVGADDPAGWNHQLENEPGLILSWQRNWPEAYAATPGSGLYFRATPHLGATLGNIYTYANAGLTLQLTPEEDR